LSYTRMCIIGFTEKR